MAEFTYKARDTQGNIKVGQIEAANEEAAADILRDHDLILTKLSENSKSGIDVSKVMGNIKRVSMKDRVVFTRQLGTMIKAGLPIVQALHILAEQTPNKKFAENIKEVSASIEGGTSFSAALAKFPKLFDRVYINLVHAGEASGNLEEVLERLADQQEKSYALARKVRGALMYPAFVLVAMAGAGVLMMLVVIPPLKTIFVDAGAELPLPTKALIWCSDAMRKFWYIIIALTGALAFGAMKYLKSDSGAIFWDRTKLKLPIFGNLFRKIYVARFTRTLASLVGGGVPILEALDITADSVGNNVFAKAIRSSAREVESGVALSIPIRANQIFPAMVPQMISVGEQTGKMDSVLLKLSEFYEDEVDNIVKNLSILMEPVLMVVMGLGVAGLLVAIMMPIYNLGSVIK